MVRHAASEASSVLPNRSTFARSIDLVRQRLRALVLVHRADEQHVGVDEDRERGLPEGVPVPVRAIPAAPDRVALARAVPFPGRSVGLEPQPDLEADLGLAAFGGVLLSTPRRVSSRLRNSLK